MKASEDDDSCSRRFREIYEGIRRLEPEIPRLAEGTYALTFGGMHNEVVRDEESWQGCLSNPDPRFRLLGLSLYTGKAPTNPHVIDRISDMALLDSEESVRISTIFALVSIFLTTSDQKILKLLAGLALEAAESNDLRKAAYWALVLLGQGRGDRNVGRRRTLSVREYEVIEFDVDYLADVLKRDEKRGRS